MVAYLCDQFFVFVTYVDMYLESVAVGQRIKRCAKPYSCCAYIYEYGFDGFMQGILFIVTYVSIYHRRSVDFVSCCFAMLYLMSLKQSDGKPRTFPFYLAMVLARRRRRQDEHLTFVVEAHGVWHQPDLYSLRHSVVLRYDGVYKMVVVHVVYQDG